MNKQTVRSKMKRTERLRTYYFRTTLLVTLLSVMPKIQVSISFGEASLTGSNGALPPTLPKWDPVYQLNLSTITMQLNDSGWSDPSRGSEFGIVSYDWSNTKKLWAATSPMDCEERLHKQAQMTKSSNPSSTRVFVYRNVVKALPWFSSVRKILDDPSYDGFFLKFRSNARGMISNNKGDRIVASESSSGYHVPQCAAENSSKCSTFYHDQQQTPQVPTDLYPQPDGSCPKISGCDCGQNPCGEYLWDHRNGTQLQNWLIENHILSDTALGSSSIDGLFIDDYWCSDIVCKNDPSLDMCPCTDPVQGPTEIDRYSQIDMGLKDNDIRDITLAWNATMGAIQRAILRANGYTWSLMSGQQNANAMPTLLKKETCAEQLRDACHGGGEHREWQQTAKLVGINVVNQTRFLQLEQDVAFFLLVRGPYAWLGFGIWGMTWPFNPQPAHGELPPLPHGVPRPPILNLDVGLPQGSCVEEEKRVFVRQWSRVFVKFDCKKFEADIRSNSISIK